MLSGSSASLALLCSAMCSPANNVSEHSTKCGVFSRATRSMQGVPRVRLRSSVLLLRACLGPILRLGALRGRGLWTRASWARARCFSRSCCATARRRTCFARTSSLCGHHRPVCS
eukprot:Amastigsp_a514962_52.p6 type:complete len:115 gc:universal Amastigsp_a514962_52:1427-1083(-)